MENEDYLVYNEDKTQILENYDLLKGHLVYDRLIEHHEAVEGTPDEGHYEVIQEYDNGGKDVKWVVDKPGIPTVEAYDVEKTIKVYIPYTLEELSDKNFNIDVQIEALNKEIGDYMLKLSQTDYRVIKYMEGFYTDEEFLPMKEQRQEWRQRINELEAEIGRLQESRDRSV